MEVSDFVRSRQLPQPELRRALRNEAGLTLAEVGDRCGVTRSAVSRWERGLRNPRGTNRVEYAKFLGELKDALHHV